MNSSALNSNLSHDPTVCCSTSIAACLPSCRPEPGSSNALAPIPDEVVGPQIECLLQITLAEPLVALFQRVRFGGHAALLCSAGSGKADASGRGRSRSMAAYPTPRA